MEKSTIQKIQKDLDDAVAAVGRKHGFAMTYGSRITYSDTGFSFKTDVVYTVDEEGNDLDPRRAEFERHCGYHGLEPEDFGKEVRIHGDKRKAFVISGIKPKARKNAIIIDDTKTGKSYVCSPDILDSLDGKMLMRGYHRCKYCGEATFGPDEDDLCYDCRSIFGHAKFSEL